MKANTFAVFFCLFFVHSLMAGELAIKISSKMDPKHNVAIKNVLLEVDRLLPDKLKAGLPEGLELRFEKLSEHDFIPSDICANDKKSKSPFVYGEYNQRQKRLILNMALAKELLRGRASSSKINCQHKSLYDQAIATIIHELTHAYDLNNGLLSHSSEFVLKAGFKKGLLKTKNKNIDAVRSADPYELKSVSESYAVNMEYFLMDSEFACRKPLMFEYLKKKMVFDPFPNRNCHQGNMVMLSTSTGSYPIELNPERVYRVDYLLAAPGKEAASGFGHSMFRIVLCAPERFDVLSRQVIPATPFGPKCLEDKLYHVVVSYRANVEDAKMSFVKGIFGGYPSMLFILNFNDVLDEYNSDELRDVASYPLKLNAREKKDFINRVLEEHWNYRGDYKFFTNNCAVESFDLLEASIASSQNPNPGTNLFSVSPVGVLEDLERLGFISLKDKNEERFKAKTEQLILSYQKAYFSKIKNTEKDKKAVLNFIAKSNNDFRREKFYAFSNTKFEKMDLHTEVSAFKNSLIISSSFSVLEQQILRTKLGQLRKKAAELLMNTKNEKIKQFLENNKTALKSNSLKLITSGYGIPLTDEVLASKDIEQKTVETMAIGANVEALMKEFFPAEVTELESINSNILIFNQKSLEIRKSYREKLNVYIHQVLTNLSLEESSRALLISSLSDDSDLIKIRELLDSNLVSKKEILDSKLRKLIQDSLN